MSGVRDLIEKVGSFVVLGLLDFFGRDSRIFLSCLLGIISWLLLWLSQDVTVEIEIIFKGFLQALIWVPLKLPYDSLRLLLLLEPVTVKAPVTPSSVASRL